MDKPQIQMVVPGNLGGDLATNITHSVPEVGETLLRMLGRMGIRDVPVNCYFPLVADDVPALNITHNSIVSACTSEPRTIVICKTHLVTQLTRLLLQHCPEKVIVIFGCVRANNTLLDETEARLSNVITIARSSPPGIYT